MWKRYVWILLLGGAASVQAQSERTSPPLVVLNHDTGNFIVLSSDIPFRVSKANPRATWFDVENAEGPQTAHRTLELTPRPGRRARGVYFGAVRIDVETSMGSDFFLIPVALRVGAEHRNAFGPTPELEARTPSRYVRLQTRDGGIEMRYRTTPGGHFLIEILDVAKQASELTSIAADLPAFTAQAQQDYELVFPWMCLENPCGIPTQTDINDVAGNLDRVNAISYERYSMQGGRFQILSGVGDPGDWGKANSLKLWPMAVGGYQPSEAQINSMWAGRETIAQGMIDAARSRGYEGYCVDVEGHAQGSSKTTFINFVTYLANRLHDNGFKLMVVHATWSTIAPIEDLSASSIDYVATMDPYTSLWQRYIPELYSKIDPSRLVWGFTWDRVGGSTQKTMWQWMASMGFNDGVAGAAAWRTPLTRPSNGVNYYTEGFETHYPTRVDLPPPICIDANVPADRWKGEYFPNASHQGAAIAVKNDGAGALDFDWGSASPDDACGIPADVFSARFTRDVAFDAGIYRFMATTDDGMRVSVGSTLVLDEWRDQVANFEKEATITAGVHRVVVSYYENRGGATAKLSWEKIADLPGGDTILIDDPELLVTSTGKMEWWHRETGVGYEGDLVWTQNTFSRQDNFARWTPILPGPGRYQVEAYLPLFDKASSQARYQIRASGATNQRIVNQASTPDAWVDLGTYEFAATNNGSEYVELGDLTGETNISKNVLFDAVRFTRDATAGCAETVPPGAWRSEYFNNTTLSGSPALVRNEGVGFVKNVWANGGPNACGLGEERFSARYTRRLSLAAGTYHFNVTSDDGVRLYLDGALVMNEWRIQGPTTFETDVVVQAGEHELRIEHYENTGYSVIDVSWNLVANACLGVVAPDRWKGEYFNGRDPNGTPVMVRDDGAGALDLDWGAASPSTSCGLPVDGFSVRWTRAVSFESGTYLFTASSDDGLRVRVGSTVVFDEWRDQVASFEREVAIPAGEHAITVEYYENGGGALAKLDWRKIATTVVDDPELLVTSTGNAAWWHRETGVGNEGDMVWTQNTFSRQDNFARWKPNLAAPGWYRVEAFIPSFNIAAASKQARYFVVAKGQTHGPIQIDQSASGGAWVVLGTFDFGGSGGAEYVELGDVTGETNISRNVLFDAVRWTPAAPNPTPAGGWAYPVGSAETGAGWRVTLGLGQSWTSSAGIQYNGHLAEDWSRTSGSTLGQPVYAAAEGKVIINLQNCGNYVDVVILEHQVPGFTQPIYTMYGHIESNGFVQVGDVVQRRQQLGVIGNPVTFGPHLHFEVKNRTALVSPPFSGCSSTSSGIYISAGYSGKRNDYGGGDFWDPSNDGVTGNHYYNPTRFIENRLP